MLKLKKYSFKSVFMKKLLLTAFIVLFMITGTMAQEKFGKGNITQIGLVVHDIEKASEKWAAILGFN